MIGGETMKNLTIGILLGTLSLNIQASNPQAITYGFGEGYAWAYNCDDYTAIHIYDYQNISQEDINNQVEKNENRDEEACNVVVIRNTDAEEEKSRGLLYAQENKDRDSSPEVLDVLLMLCRLFCM
ncbi:hypothetical protein BJAS_P4021 [Bathymodiolus japonicus methanotrophic gill symbiont]|nr:hypothetical protein BJAS_P4021 [Bathymodiolus japonicus methanotrophic gill symbiont]